MASVFIFPRMQRSEDRGLSVSLGQACDGRLSIGVTWAKWGRYGRGRSLYAEGGSYFCRLGSSCLMLGIDFEKNHENVYQLFESVFFSK